MRLNFCKDSALVLEKLKAGVGFELCIESDNSHDLNLAGAFCLYGHYLKFPCSFWTYVIHCICNVITKGDSAMAKTSTINMRVSPEVKSDAESIFASLGMTLTEAINVFLHKSIMEGGLPFDVRQPRYNAETEAAIREARDIMSGKIKADSYDSAAALDE